MFIKRNIPTFSELKHIIRYFLSVYALIIIGYKILQYYNPRFVFCITFL